MHLEARLGMYPAPIVKSTPLHIARVHDGSLATLLCAIFTNNAAEKQVQQ
jgi:hypothetical protein